ncbi:hypothetical protein M9H77_16103 [Catharanthus roseus]|uniref:Uncharacterized protein n=1 Tax=Catharanthus roseus TaxID=4058 RepID=A0ACC0AZE8_CATRO|nr:hypothetical protein M9H77_16103 [Catharanthus roseus]
MLESQLPAGASWIGFALQVKLHWHSRLHSISLQKYNRIGRCCFLQQSKSVGSPKLIDHRFASLSRKIRFVKADDVESNVPTTLTPVQEANVEKSNKQRLAAICGGAAVALLVVIVLALLYFCLTRLKRLTRRSSVAESSFPSSSVEWRRTGSHISVAQFPWDANDFREFTLLDLEQATGNFDERNFIGEGTFGKAYKGLLEDGTIVVVKRCIRFTNKSLLYEVKHIANINHKHLVKLVGFCDENHQQFLVNDYHLNGNVGSHLYDTEGLPIGKLDVLQRISIAIGAAKGLEHLHSLLPPIPHMRFRTSNVLVDENFTAKVSDFGIFKFVFDYNTLPSSATDCFLDPELISFKNVTAKFDVYSFGVFLLELISGREAIFQQNLVLQAKDLGKFEDFVDKTIRKHSMETMREMLDLALLCVDGSVNRPSMENVVEELERIQREIKGYDTIEEIGNVTLGSELFNGSSSAGVQSPIS